MVHKSGEELEQMSRKSRVPATWAIVWCDTYRALDDENSDNIQRTCILSASFRSYKYTSLTSKSE